MTTSDKVLLVLGVILFVALLVVLIINVKSGGSVAVLLPFFLLPIGMIAFPEIKSISVKDGGVEIDKLETINANVISNFIQNPNNIEAANKYRAELTRLDNVRSAHPNTALPSQTRSNLEFTVSALNRRGNLTPESLAALSHAQLLLGQTNAAVTNLNRAVKANTNIVHTIDPRLKTLLMRERPGL